MNNYKEFPTFGKAIDLFLEERYNQLIKWGPNDFKDKSPYKILAVLSEEHGEIARALLEHDDENLLEEIVQLGALCCKWVEEILQSRVERKNVSPTSSLPCTS